MEEKDLKYHLEISKRGMREHERIEKAKHKIRHRAGGGAIELSTLIEDIVPITREDVRQAAWEMLDDGEFTLTPDRMFTDARIKEEMG